MEIQASRTAARVDAQGVPILLLAQNRARWDPLLIRRGLRYWRDVRPCVARQLPNSQRTASNWPLLQAIEWRS